MIVFDNMIADMLNNTLTNDIFIRGRKLNIPIVFVTQSYFSVHKILIVFDDIIADMLNNTVVTELFIRGRKLNIPTVFITQSHFAGPKDIRLSLD